MEDSNCCSGGSVCGCNCPDDKTNKLCTLAKPKQNFDVEKIKRLVDNPKYLCTCCGRAANDKENLCSPTQI